MGNRLGSSSWIIMLALAAGAGAVWGQEEPPSPAASPPRLQVDSDTIDLGDVSRGEDAQATFHLRNTGGETLKILRVKPG